jgi:hypothetical protein
MAGSLGFSSLICLLNNGDSGRPRPTPTCWVRSGGMDSPRDQERRFDRALADARARAVRRCLVPRRERQADRRRRGRYLAVVARGLLREPGSRPGRHEPARQVHHRQGWAHQLSQREAGRLSDPDRRSGRRPVARCRPAQYAPVASAFPRLQAGLQDADLADLSARTTKISRPTCSSASPTT